MAEIAGAKFFKNDVIEVMSVVLSDWAEQRQKLCAEAPDEWERKYLIGTIIEKLCDKAVKSGPKPRAKKQLADHVTARLSEIARRPALLIAESLDEVRIVTER